MTRAVPLITLHSGGLGTRPNSLEYLNRARMARPDIIEVDVRRTRDNIAVLRHDPYLEADGERLVLEDHTFRGLLESDPLLVNLEEALAFSRFHSLRLNLDLKEISAAGPTLDLLRKQAPDFGHIITGCGLEEVKELRSAVRDFHILLNVETAPSGEARYVSFMTDLCAEACELGCPGLNINYRLCRPELSGICRARDLPIFVWTVDEEEDMRRMLSLGVYSITTHDVDQLRGIIGEDPELRPHPYRFTVGGVDFEQSSADVSESVFTFGCAASNSGIHFSFSPEVKVGNSCVRNFRTSTLFTGTESCDAAATRAVRVQVIRKGP